ncbi:MAG: hypothetical protein CM15mP4_1770 [Candidatus Neomarinimicrobiota bacterium]|nr:MAG: hypothetical protein CM15mP4_1770 [Candidatus Neomarinimicrobiota bacterium]
MKGNLRTSLEFVWELDGFDVTSITFYPDTEAKDLPMSIST